MPRFAVAVFCLAAARAQNFEVASIKVRQLPLHTIAGYSSSGPRVTYEAWPIRLLIVEAYGVKGYQVAFAGAAPPNDVDYYDILAKAEGDAPRTRAQFRPLLKALLADRFHLTIHRETRELAVYALVRGKSAPKLKQSETDNPPPTHFGVNGRNQFVESKRMTIDDFAGAIRDCFGLDRPVVDRTGLTGLYDVKLEATPEYRLRNPEDSDLSVFTAIQQQLGLKLEPGKAPFEVIVIDGWDKPSAN